MFGRDVTGARFGSLPVHRASAVERLYELATETTRVAAAGQVNERADGDGALFEVTLTGESVPSAVTEHGTNVRSMHAAAGREARRRRGRARGERVRSLVAYLEDAFPATELRSKRELDRPIERIETLSEGAFGDLTDRQREALEAAYHAWYFD